MASLGLHCCTAASLAAVSRGFSAVALRGLLTVTAPLAENRLYRERASAVVAHGLNCPEACGIPRIRHQPMAPALEGGFFAAGPPEQALPALSSLHYSKFETYLWPKALQETDVSSSCPNSVLT